MENPFHYGGIVLGPYFADRQQEIRELKREAKNLSRIFLVSPRRYGKTCLLFNLMASFKTEKIPAAYLDFNAYPDIRSLAAGYALQTCKALETNRDKLMKLLSGLKNFTPRFSLEANGTTIAAELISTIPDKDALTALLESMQHAEKLAARKRQKLIVILDEFSELTKFNGHKMEKALRSQIQTHQSIAYIFSGSEQSMILAMLRDRKRAFYKLGRIMELRPIDRKTYTNFILRWLKKGRIRASYQDLQRLFELGADIPYNIQRLCYNMWDLAQRDKKVTSKILEELPVSIARQDSPHYEIIWRTATPLQKKILIALSQQPKLKPLSKEFALQYQISPPSSIKASLVSLMKKGIIYRTLEGKYQFTDNFMPYWIEAMI
ncbi:MAG: ATP-binding protein [Desulfobacterales bacterium]